jgi:hypothetical protein
MPSIIKSEKFESEQIQVCVIAGNYVILRAIYRQQDVALMTATAPERLGGLEIQTYPNRMGLLEAAESVFDAVGGDVTRRQDRDGRQYVQSVFPDAWANISTIADQLASALQLHDVQILVRGPS